MIKSKNHLAALKYAAKGIPIFPCVENGKSPATAHGFKDATRDTAQIDAWFSENPNFNIGSSPHAAECCVIDVDAPEAIPEIEMIYGMLPATLTIQTPRGGFHYWFKGEMGSADAGLFPAHVDVRGRGGYVLLPPSSINGKEYRVVDKSPPAPLPASIGTMLAAKSSAAGMVAPEHETDAPWALQRGLDAARAWAAGDDPSLIGKCDDTAIKHGYVLAEMGLSADGVYKCLTEGWNVRLADPMTDDAMRRISRSSLTSAQNDLGIWAVADPAITYASFLGQEFKEIIQSLSRFTPLTETEMEGLPPPTWLLPGVLPDKQLVMLYAPSFGWKTFLALDWSMTIASGIDKWGAVEAGPVVYIAAEGATGLGKVRRPAWRLLHGIDRPVPFHIVRTMPHVEKQHELVELCEAIKKKVGKPRLLIIDTLARFMAGLDESSTRDASVTIELLEMLRRELDCTILALHHTGKDVNRGERGSSALRAGFDTMLKLIADKDSGTAQLWAEHKDAEASTVPWNLKAEKVLDSLVFRMASAEDMPMKDRLTPSDVGIVLRNMKVFSADNAVPEPVVVTEISKMKNWHEKKTRAAFKSLLKTGRLTAYEVAPGGPFYFTEPPTAEF